MIRIPKQILSLNMTLGSWFLRFTYTRKYKKRATPSLLHRPFLAPAERCNRGLYQLPAPLIHSSMTWQWLFSSDSQYYPCCVKLLIWNNLRENIWNMIFTFLVAMMLSYTIWLFFLWLQDIDWKKYIYLLKNLFYS